MSIDQYREFLELAHCLNYTEAAANLHMTQPALSKHIVGLEKEFGGQLFARDRRSVRLTEAGRILVGAATQMVTAYDRAREGIALVASDDPVRVDGVLFDTQLTSILALATTIRNAEGAAPFIFEHRDDVDLLGLLDSDEVDLVLAYAHESTLAERGFLRRPLVTVSFVAVLDRTHPLAKRETLRMEDLRDETFVQFIDEYSISGWRSVEEACLNHGFSPKTRPILGRAHTSYATTPPEGGVLILQENLPQLRYLQDIGSTVAIPVTDEDAHFQINCIFKAEDAERLASVVRAFEQARDLIARHEAQAAR